MGRIHAWSRRGYGDVLKDVDVAQRSVEEWGEFLAAVDTAGYIEPWYWAGRGGEVADEANILIVATVWGFSVCSQYRRSCLS